MSTVTKVKDTCSLRGKLWKTYCIKKNRHHFAAKDLYSQSCGFSSSHVWVWELDHKEVLSTKELIFLDCGSEVSWESLGLQDQISWSSGKQPWIFIGRTDAEAEAPILWPPDARADSLEKTLIIGKIERESRRGWQRMRWFDSITNSMDMNLPKLQEIVKDREAWHVAVHGAAKRHDWATEWLFSPQLYTLAQGHLNVNSLRIEISA